MRVFFARPNSPMTVAPVPMGLGYLSHAIKQRRDDHTMIVDGRRFRLGPDRIVDRARDFGAEAVCITSMTFEAPEALALISEFKRAMPEVPVILGGPHATGYGPSLLDECKADFLVMGEGEQTLTDLLSVIEGKNDLDQIPGLARRKDGRIIAADPPEPIQDMQTLDVDWDAIGPEHYFSSWRRNAMNTIARTPRRLPVFFSRGCPMGCAYCHHIFGRKWRPFPIELTVARMKELRDRYRLGEFEIIDDNFNLKLDHAKAAMQEIIDRGLNVGLTFTNGLRADRMDEELLDLMVRAGTYRIDYAVETASPRIQTLIHKNLDLPRAREVIDMTAKKGVVTGAYYMLGFPGETRAEMEATVEYAVSLKNHISSFFYLMPFPGTEISEQDPEVSRRVRQSTFRDASGIAINLSAEPDQVLERTKRAAYRRFYFSPGRVLRISRDVPKNLRLLASALAVARMSVQESVNY